ncbi:hypothetical protein ES703_123634 [subsurface metagenome]
MDGVVVNRPMLPPRECSPNYHGELRAKIRGWRLAASGDGLFNEKGERIAGDTEESIYKALGLPYQPPERR